MAAERFSFHRWRSLPTIGSELMFIWETLVYAGEIVMIRSYVLSVLIVAITVIGFFASLEVYVRFAVDDGLQFDLEMWKYANQIKNAAENEAQGHEHKPNSSAILMGVEVSINRHKLRNREISDIKPEETVRILMLGDSITFGWGVRSEQTVSSQLQTLLNSGAHNGQVEVINAGVGNTNTEMQVAYFFKEGKALSPDIVVLNYFINDAEITPRKNESVFGDYSYAYVYLYGLVDNMLRQYFGAPSWDDYYLSLYADDFPGWIRATRAIRQLVDYTRKHKVKLLFVNYPELHRLENYRFNGVHDKIEAVAKALRIPYLDLLPSVIGQHSQDLWVTPTDAHPNGEATAMYAAAIANKLQEDYGIE